MKRLKEERLKHDITQEELAEKIGKSRQYLQMIESGKRIPPDKTQADIWEALDELRVLKSDCRLEVHVDYVRLHFTSKDVKYVVEKALRLPFEKMYRQDRAYFGFKATYQMLSIHVLEGAKDDEDRNTLLELKSRGCRLFERHLESINWTWFDFFQHCLDNFDVRVKRLDLAVDDYDGLLNIPELKRKCRTFDWDSRWIRNYSGYESGQRLRSEDEEIRETMGETLYIGSLKSELHFCVYQKDYERYKKEGIPVDETEVKNRFEIRLRNDRASKAVEDLIERQDVDSTIFDIINRYITFTDCPRWEKFMGEDRGELRLTMKPEPYTVDRTKKWFKTQVASSFIMLKTLDDIEGGSFVTDALSMAALSEQHVRAIEQAAYFKSLEACS